MNLSEYTYLLNNPNAINEKQAKALEVVLDNFPYFQSARALYLKGLYNQDSYKYNFALKHTAAHTSDRSVLFDFITSDEFTIIEKDIYERKLAELQDIIVNDSELLVASENSIQKEEIKKIIEVEIENVEISTEETFSADLTILPEETEAAKEKSISNEVELEIIEDQNIPSTTIQSEAIEIEDKLEIGKPIAFSQNEKHSFEEWLQITKIQPIDRTESSVLSIKPTIEATSEAKKESNSKKKKIELIDKFIESNPKITPAKDIVEKATIAVESSDNTQLMTETLARVYLEQKKYQKAIQAYEILILKYPEKSIFFADRIKDIKILQQNNQ
ncbi:tetratricopeptide repeat protein [Flavobacterium sp. UBA6135]|uniref:tetratricopeptide repeat protein n=1 Tax=Flavobacterium sp. UBA6135 TaxID=1946553 RepID=UPI0025C63EEA|nr:hypothetical protein [Flavobacterium sp. UBA6135]